MLYAHGRAYDSVIAGATTFKIEYEVNDGDLMSVAFHWQQDMDVKYGEPEQRHPVCVIPTTLFLLAYGASLSNIQKDKASIVVDRFGTAHMINHRAVNGGKAMDKGRNMIRRLATTGTP
jgi:hypothetical protein